ncbi:MAG: winged helix-turn-helix transcriptional regulator [Proteobacteria bacterium]|nr:winged helix-turn-helix transcriptional regulator [Pseudomonadota bacterium]
MPDRVPPWMADEGDAPTLREPRSLLDLVNYQMHMIESYSASNVTRMCEGEFGITRREWRFIALLAALGAMAPSDLAVRAGLDRSRTSKALMALLAKKLIVRRSQPGDRRRAQVTLTADGQALYARMFPRVIEVNTTLLSVLSDEDVATLERVLPVLRRQAIAIVNSGLVAAQADRRHGGSLKHWKGGRPEAA